MLVVVRDATDEDMPAIQPVYAAYVLNSLATFEQDPPSVDELITRRGPIVAARLPYLVATIGTELVGFAYASPYRSRPAYRHTVEDSVYVRADLHSRGIGSALLSQLIARCEAGPWRQMIAVIGDSANAGSIALHSHFGFAHVGTLQAVGFKLGRWVDTVLMQRALGSGAETDPAPFAQT